MYTVYHLVRIGVYNRLLTDSVHLCLVGTLYSMSPETMQGIYTSQADLWSIGVCTYMMMTGGQKPFEATTPKKLVARVLLGNYDFDDEIWEGASDKAKEFIKELLVVDPHNRITADQALYHPWLTNVSSHDGFSAAPDEAFVQRVREGIVTYADQGEFRKLALNVIAKKVSFEFALLPLVVVIALIQHLSSLMHCSRPPKRYLNCAKYSTR
jgi:serine/threonine protein kinase